MLYPVLLRGVLPGAWPTRCVLEIQNRVEHESVIFIIECRSNYLSRAHL